MKLRWKAETEKRWHNFIHEDGVEDGHYKYFPTGSFSLQFSEPTCGCCDDWENVLDEDGEIVYFPSKPA